MWNYARKWQKEAFSINSSLILTIFELIFHPPPQICFLSTPEDNITSHVRDHPVIEETVPEVLEDSNVDNADGNNVQEYATVEEHVEPRPKRVIKPNKKYDPDIYDLSYVGQRRKSRKSVKRAVYGRKDA